MNTQQVNYCTATELKCQGQDEDRFKCYCYVLGFNMCDYMI